MIRFKISGINFEISFLLICMLTLTLIVYGEYILFACLFSAIFHELCHILFLFLFGAGIKKLKFQLSGIVIVQNQELSQHKKAIVLSAGCLGNLLLFTIFILIQFKFLATLNLCLTFFNILPHEKLDGGQLINLLSQKSINFSTYYKIQKYISMLISIILFVFGIFFVIYFKNITLLILAFMLISSD